MINKCVINRTTVPTVAFDPRLNSRLLAEADLLSILTCLPAPGITLWQGDCLALMRDIPDRSIDVILNDPPYGTTHCKWDLALDLTCYWAHILRVLKPDGAVIIFSAQPFTSKLILSQPDLYRYLWYWEKEKGTNFFRANREPMRVIEEILVFGSPQHRYFPQLLPLDKPYRHTMPLHHSSITGCGPISHLQTAEEREYREYTHAQPKNLLTLPRDATKKSLVPTQKPVALMEYLIKTYTTANDRVLDPTMGSGTTGVACVRLGREFIGIEMNSDHFTIASERISESVSTFSLFGF